MASQLGASRLLLAMGQDGAIPRKFFGQVSRRNRIPSNNVIMIGAICLVGALLMSYERGAELLNYGALLAFMGVNLSSAVLGWRQGRGSQWFWILISMLGFAVCLFIWLNLSHPAIVVGTAWAVFGVIVWLLHGRRARNPQA
jgi:amino acid transporter